MSMTKRKLSLRYLLNRMSAEQKEVSYRILKDYKGHIDRIPGSKTKHQNWEGGYIDHVVEVMNIAVRLYNTLNALRPLDFELSDALFTLFIHDFDKVMRYESKEGKVISKGAYTSDYIQETTQLLQHKYQYTLDENELNAIRYVHGEGKDYHPIDRIMNPLACLIHCCDIISARIWFDYGKNKKHW